MKVDTQSEVRNVAAPAADPGPVFPVLIRNPLVALAMALIGPIIGLFRRRETPTAAAPTPPPSTPSPQREDGRGDPTRGANDASARRAVSVRAYTRSAPVGRTAAQKGGRHHG